MPNRHRTHFSDSDVPGDNLVPQHLTHEQFGRRIYDLMIRKGWHQSELARRADIGRDRISSYIRGASMPGPVNVRKLAKALGVDPEKLLPNLVEDAVQQSAPQVDMKISQTRPDVAWLRIDRAVKTATAIEIVNLLAADQTTRKSDEEDASGK